MKCVDGWELSRRQAVGAAIPQVASRSGRQRIGLGWLSGIWVSIAYPFQKSIHVRFRYAFGLAALGLAVMAVITIISGRVLLNTYEESVSEAKLELMPIHHLQVSLREVDHLAYRFAIEGHQSTSFEFEALRQMVDRQFGRLAEAQSHFTSVEHAHSKISVSEIRHAWQEVQVAMLAVFQHAAGSKEATEALGSAHAKIDPIYDVVSEFHLLSMEDLQERLRFARSVAGWAFIAIFAAILVGLVLLIAMGLIVGRSLLHPIAKLQVAARKLIKKDFSHRVRLRNTRDELGQLGRSFNIASASLQRLHRELERRSTQDGLTGALNRLTFDERLSEECKSADRHKRSLSLLMVDVDFFKRVNDTHGHQAGDRVLQAVVQILNETVRPGDVVARYGGEEFTIILPETDEDSAMTMAERLREIIENTRIDCMSCGDIGVTVSIGCASRQPHALSPEFLIKDADAALYRAKKTGRNRVVAARTPALTPAAGRQSDAA